MRNIVKRFDIFNKINENSNGGYSIVSREEFQDALLELSTLELEDEQVRYPKTSDRTIKHMFGGNTYDLYILDREKLPDSGPFEMIIEDNNEDIIGFVRGTKKDNIISFNLIHIKDDYRGAGIGTEIYEHFLKDGFIIMSDSEITDSTYSLYDKLALYGYKPLIFDNGRVGLKK